MLCLPCEIPTKLIPKQLLPPNASQGDLTRDPSMLDSTTGPQRDSVVIKIYIYKQIKDCEHCEILPKQRSHQNSVEIKFYLNKNRLRASVRFLQKHTYDHSKDID